MYVYIYIFTYDQKLPFSPSDLTSLQCVIQRKRFAHEQVLNLANHEARHRLCQPIMAAKDQFRNHPVKIRSKDSSATALPKPKDGILTMTMNAQASTHSEGDKNHMTSPAWLLRTPSLEPPRDAIVPRVPTTHANWSSPAPPSATSSWISATRSNHILCTDKSFSGSKDESKCYDAGAPNKSNSSPLKTHYTLHASRQYNNFETSRIRTTLRSVLGGSSPRW